MTGIRRGEGTTEDGFCWIDLILAMAIAAAVAALVVPLTARGLDAAKARDAAAFVGSRIRQAKQHAAASGRATAIVFDQGPDGWSLRLCVDGNGNGVRRVDLAAGRDTCTDGPWAIARQFPGIAIGADASVPGPDGEPGSADPVRFGRSDMVSCTSAGGCTAGSVCLRSAAGEPFLIRVGGAGARTRVLRFDRGSRHWVPA